MQIVFGLLALFPVIVLGFDLTLLHTNDIHARIEQMNKYGGQCSVEDAAAGKCFGGYARLKTKIKEIRASRENTLLLDGGDQYSGTLWFYKFQGPGIAQFMNHLGYDGMTIGNHEFDKGPEGLIPFFDIVNFTIVSSNIIVDPTSPLNGRFKKSHVFTVGGEKIGVVGYTTRHTPIISNPGRLLTFEDEVVAVRREVIALKQQGINKIIALGHSGFTIDKRIAESVADIDVVVGGHDNTFLYSGEPPSNEDPVGQYPHVVTQSNGAKVLVVQDYAFGKYLGELHMTFNPQGVITSWSGNPILLDNSTAQDPATLAFLEPFRQQVIAETLNIVGRTHVFLTGERSHCRLRECNLGNLIADSMVRQNIKHSDSIYWNNVSIAIVNSGGIRSSIERGDISLGQAATVMPFGNTIDIVELYGRHLIGALEHSVSKHIIDNPVEYGGFLQVSGLKVEYDTNRPVGDRVVRARALCTRCKMPKYEDINKDEIYQVLTNNFIARGGDGYSVISDNIIKEHLIGDLDLDIFVEYIKQYSPIIHGEEERILFTNKQPCDDKWPTSGSSLPSVCFTVFLTTVLLAVTG